MATHIKEPRTSRRIGAATAKTIPRRASRLIGGALLCALALDVAAAWFAAAAWNEPSLASEPAAQQEWRPPTPLLGAPPVAPAAHADAQTLSRPLFERTRRPIKKDGGPAEADAKKPEAETIPANLAVKAIVRFRGGKRAFVTYASLPDGEWRAPGESIDGWTVARIDAQALTLKRGARSERIELTYDDAPRTKAAPPTAPPQPPPTPIQTIRGRRG